MQHGGDVISYREFFSGELLDFSSNINPLGFPPGLSTALSKNLAVLQQYPDIQYRALKQEVAAYLGCTSERVIVGNGAMEIIDAFMQHCDATVVCPPCFSEYKTRASVHRKKIIEVPQLYRGYFSLDETSIEKALHKKSMLVLTNPNNPTGHTISREQLERIYKIVLEKKAFLLLDETFFEFTELRYDSVALFKKYEYHNVAIIRAATKFFGLPGLRLAYACTSEKTAAVISSYQLSWHVNALAEIAGTVIFRDKSYIEKSKAYIKVEREFLLHELKKISGILVFKTEANFILLRLDSATADEVFDFFVRRGIILRKANNFFTVFGNTPDAELALAEWIRIAVKSHADNLKLISVFREWSAQNDRTRFD